MCDDTDVAEWARARGALVVWEPGRGLNGAVEAGIDHLRGRRRDPGHRRPRRPAPGHRSGRWWARRRGSPWSPTATATGPTSSPCPAMPASGSRTGPGSFARHRAEAERLGLPCRVLDRPDLAWDIDEPGDVVPVAALRPPTPGDGDAAADGPRRPARAGCRWATSPLRAGHRRPARAGQRTGHRCPSRRHRVRVRRDTGQVGGGGLPPPPPGPHRRLQGQLGPRRRPRRPGGDASGTSAGPRPVSSTVDRGGPPHRRPGVVPRDGWTASWRTASTSDGRWPGSSAPCGPTVVLGHDPWRRYRLHPDHRAAGFLTVDALVAARDPHFFAELGLAPAPARGPAPVRGGPAQPRRGRRRVRRDEDRRPALPSQPVGVDHGHRIARRLGGKATPGRRPAGADTVRAPDSRSASPPGCAASWPNTARWPASTRPRPSTRSPTCDGRTAASRGRSRPSLRQQGPEGPC